MAASRRKSESVAVSAKISVPRLAETYRRGRLFRALDAARRKRVVWIAAPAGAGKTSVVATYLAERRLPALWYNVDARDADVANLFHYLSLAARASRRRKKVDLPSFTSDNQFGPAAFAHSFFEALCNERPLPSVIVLDDYHEAGSALWDDVIREATSALPRGIAAVIISRAAPPAAFARQIASGDFALLGWDELRLTAAETTALVRLCRPDLRGQELRGVVRSMLDVANGWAAATALLLQDRHFAGSGASSAKEFSEPLFDYFAAEILDKVNSEERDFLLRTSVVPSLTPALATRLTEAPDADRILAALERRSFLTQRLGQSGRYRYHPLLRGFLERRAVHELGEGTMRELHQRAALAFVEADQIDEAIDQLERAEDVAKRRDLILGAAPSYFAKGCGRTVSAWVERMPIAMVEQDGWLLYWQALCCVGHEPSRAHTLFERAFARFAKEDDARGLHQSCAMAMQAIYYEGMDFSKFDPWLQRFEEMQVSGPPCPDDFLPMAATSRLLATFGRTVDVKDHLKWIGRATALAGACGDMSHRIMTGGLVALYFVFNENPARAAPILEMLRESARAQLSPIAPLTLFQADAWCAWARGENAACVSLAREALTIAARTGIYVWNDYIFGTGASATLSEEDTDAAREFLDGLAEGAKHGGRSAQGSYCFYAGWDAMVRGDLTGALGFAEMAYESACALGYPFGQEVAVFGLGQVRLRLGQFREGSENIEVARGLAEQECNWMVLSGCDLVLADTLWEADRPRALTALRRGLALGREHGYFNFLWIDRSMMARLAARALDENIESEYARALILKRRLRPVGEEAATLDGWPWSYRFRVLGTFAIDRTIDERQGARPADGSAFSPPRGMPLRLLRAILALGGRGVPDTVLIDALWPDAEGDAGRRVFDTTLHRLRRQLGDDGILRLVDGRLHLDERTCWVDLWAFDASLGKIKEAVRLGSSSATLPTLCRQLLDFYRGPLLDDALPDEDFLAQPRRRRAMQFADAAEHLGQALEKVGHHADAVSLYRRVLDGDTGIERAYAGLIRCASSTGRHADAARLLDESRRRQREGARGEPGGAPRLRLVDTPRRSNIVR